MKKLITLITGLSLAITPFSPLNAQPDLLNTALKNTQQDQFEEAIKNLQTAAEWFYNNNDYANAYLSSFLANYLNDLDISNSYYQDGQSIPLASWYKLGSCLDNDCLYSLVWANPSPLGGRFGGVLILEKRLRYISDKSGGERPINAIVDVKLVPPLAPGEIINIGCSENIDLFDSQQNNLIALVNLKGYSDANFFTEVKQAWRVNLATETIDSVSLSNLPKAGCINPCPGGC